MLVREVKSSSNACDEVVRSAMDKKANGEPEGENGEDVVNESGDPSDRSRDKR